MARFHFPLAPVQTLRQLDVDEQQRAMQQATAQYQSALSRHQDLTAHLSMLDARRPLDPQGQINHNRYRAHLTELLAEHQKELTAAEEAMHVARKQLQQAQQSLESLNSLEAKQKAEWLFERQKAEQSMLDEMATLRFGKSG
ncbi:MAG: flagellar export protein FliJ [Bradymonadia bacterium]